jgi:hypothetical protein
MFVGFETCHQQQVHPSLLHRNTSKIIHMWIETVETGGSKPELKPFHICFFFLLVLHISYPNPRAPGSIDSKTRLKNLAKGAGTKDALGSWSVVGHIGMLIIIGILLT